MPNTEDEIPKAYQVQITAVGLDGAPDFEDFNMIAWCPAVIDISTESGWNAPFQSLGGEVFSSLIQEAGGQIADYFGRDLPAYSGWLQSVTKAYWTGSSPIRMTLPLEFRAIDSAKLDVTEQAKRLHLLTLPIQSGTDLVPPGPDRGIQVGVNIGNFLTFTDVVVTQVGSEIRMIMDEAGYPVKAVTRFQFQTRKIVTQSEFNSIFI